jgi:hypothetical protein
MCECGCQLTDNGGFETVVATVDAEAWFPTTTEDSFSELSVIPPGQPQGPELDVVIGGSDVQAQPSLTSTVLEMLGTVPADSPEAAALRSILDSQTGAVDAWLRPSHDIYGNSL